MDYIITQPYNNINLILYHSYMGENAASIRAEVERNAASIATAFENQLDALYAAESMDLSADLTVLQNMLKGQGLG